MQLITRRTKFLIFTILYIFGLLSFRFFTSTPNLFVLLFLFSVLIINLIALYPGYRVKDLFYISFEPIVIATSTLYGLLFFPNLNIYFQVILILVSGVMLYISTLTNNLIIAEKIEDASLPLFRVALLWTQILLILQSIPLITVIYKLNLPFYIQSIIILSYFLLASYSYLHTLLLNNKEARVDDRELFVLVIQMGSLPFIASLYTSFMPAESFLRATFITSVYMGVVGYIRNYLENSITKKLIVQYSAIIIFFLLALVLLKE
jgi:hypothetical protein